jgi:hypothetical protein
MILTYLRHGIGRVWYQIVGLFDSSLKTRIFISVIDIPICIVLCSMDLKILSRSGPFNHAVCVHVNLPRIPRACPNLLLHSQGFDYTYLLRNTYLSYLFTLVKSRKNAR